MNPQFVKDTIHKLMELFERQDFSEVLRHTIIRRHPDDTVPSDKWSLGNRLLMVLSGTLDARGYKQWLDVGRHVRKGETSIKIVAPILRRSKKEAADDTEPAFQLVGFCPIAVFAVEATDGKPLPEYHNDNNTGRKAFAPRDLEMRITVNHCGYSVVAVPGHFEDYTTQETHYYYDKDGKRHSWTEDVVRQRWVSESYHPYAYLSMIYNFYDMDDGTLVASFSDSRDREYENDPANGMLGRSLKDCFRKIFKK